MSLVARFFQAHSVKKREMNKEFESKGYNSLMVRRFIFGRVLGYAPNIKDMTISEMEQVIHYLRTN
ncbi:hypothetical protein [Bacillus wiedmannii]|uniref:hypothetical protein n=1 Tax=Bacillus wiedmannii TaxID=1890302 RepID=UPI0012469EAA|nr:hypothetical protein [Bacillus wiedmannii]